MEAALNGNKDITNLLLSKDANIDLVDSQGFSALAFAIRESKEEIVEILLKKKAVLR